MITAAYFKDPGQNHLIFVDDAGRDDHASIGVPEPLWDEPVVVSAAVYKRRAEGPYRTHASQEQAAEKAKAKRHEARAAKMAAQAAMFAKEKRQHDLNEMRFSNWMRHNNLKPPEKSQNVSPYISLERIAKQVNLPANAVISTMRQAGIPVIPRWVESDIPGEFFEEPHYEYMRVLRWQYEKYFKLKSTPYTAGGGTGRVGSQVREPHELV